jgi:predicted aspartyl protease
MPPERRCRLAAALLAAALLATATGIGAAPLTVASSGHPVAPVSVDDGPAAAFIIDTGAEGSAVYRWFAERHALPMVGAERLDGQTGSATLPMRAVRTVAIDQVRSGALRIVELADQPDRREVAGILGLDVMRGHLIEFDFPGRQVLFHDRSAAGRIIRTLGKPFRTTRVTGGLLSIPVRLNGVTGHAVIDTGARESRANEAFAQAAALAATNAPPRSIRGATDKAATLRTAAVSQMQVPGHDLGATTIRIADLPVFATFGWAGQPAMLLGFDHLRRFRMLIDIDRGELWLEGPAIPRSTMAPMAVSDIHLRISPRR